jgi:regulatory protein
VRARASRRDDEASGGGAKPTAKALAVRWLARRDLSRSELTQRLQRRGIEEPEIERALDELAALGYLSDARYASAVVAHRKGRYGKRAIVHALAARGIAGDDATTALAQLAGNDELADALVLWQRRFGAAPRDERDKARQVRFLQARGYSLSVALSVMRKAGTPDADDAL